MIYYKNNVNLKLLLSYTQPPDRQRKKILKTFFVLKCQAINDQVISIFKIMQMLIHFY
jgi:hypothetical protein